MIERPSLKSNHRKIYEFLKQYEFYHSFISSRSPRPLRGWRIAILFITICITAAIVRAIFLKDHTWTWTFMALLVIDILIIFWLIRNAIKLIIGNYGSLPFKKMFELEVFVREDLSLDDSEIESTAEMCFKMAERYKRNYFKLEVPLTFVTVIASILAIIKNITFEVLSQYTVAFALILFALWHAVANVVTALDLRSKRYFDAYEFLTNIRSSRDYERMRREFLEGKIIAVGKIID